MKMSLRVAAVMVVAVAGCGNSSKPPATPQCLHTSECSGQLVCSLGFCVKACDSSRDCPNGERCVISDVSDPDAATGTGTACLAPETATCTYNSQCKTPLVCSVIDGQCRDGCVTDVDCPTDQLCTKMTHLCVDPTLDKNYDPNTMDLKPTSGGFNPDAAGAGGLGGSGAGGMSGAHGGSGGGGAAGSFNSCPTPQTQFGATAIGDANSAFTSGIGVRDGNKLIVFSAYVAPASDASSDPAGNFIYLQTFDATTGNSDGPAASLLKTADGPYFWVADASVAPTGEIAVLHSRAAVGQANQSQLYATFLASPTAPSDGGVSDGGVPGLQVVRTIQLESVTEGEPHVVWSKARQAFIISWKYAGTAWFTRVRKFLPDGRPAGGDTNAVPTATGSNNDNSWDDGQVGTSGTLIGSSYRNYSTGIPFLTILDADGLQVGDFLPLSGLGVSHWVSVGGTTNGFVSLFNSGATVYGVFVPTSGAGSVITDGGAPVDGGDAGAGTVFSTFSVASNATTAKMVSDDTGGVGGVGAVLLESNGASFIYVTADGAKHFATGTVISSANGAQVGLSNYQGSFALSLFDSATHATQVAATGCSP